jgi:sodium-dependent dicarboxylate transporter 2/3/5
MVARSLAVALLCATWWVTEAIPPPATALVPALALPLLGVQPAIDVLASYADPLIFLFLGGFLIAQAMRTSALDMRVATVTLSLAGTRPSTVLAAFMTVTAILSAFISNTATTAMMLPIGLSVLEGAGLRPGSRYGKALLLGVAWAASIGGVVTLVGTPPNAAFAAFSSRLLHRDMSFARWLVVGAPFAVLMLPTAWGIVLARFRPEVEKVSMEGGLLDGRTNADLRSADTSLGRVSTGTVFIVTALLWMTHGLWHHLPWDLAGHAGNALSDSSIAILGGLSLFLVPARIHPYTPVLDWNGAKGLPWGVLVLFGGGLALGKGLFTSGAAEWLAGHLSGAAALPLPVLIVLVCIMAMLVTEVTSNTATANMLIPLLFVLASSIGVDGYLLAIPATVACSAAFMLPVATPPNAIVYGTGYIGMTDMVLTGMMLNAVSVIIIVLLTMGVTAPSLNLLGG